MGRARKEAFQKVEWPFRRNLTGWNGGEIRHGVLVRFTTDNMHSRQLEASYEMSFTSRLPVSAAYCSSTARSSPAGHKRKKAPRSDQKAEPGSMCFESRLPRSAPCRVQVDYGLIAALKDSESAFL